jgi:hypothetical protein
MFVAGAVTGCGESGPQRFRLQGTVEFDGKPVPAGSVYLDPDATKGNKGPQGFATIVDGKFDTQNGGKGHVGGAMRVRIVGLATAAAATTTSDEGTPSLFPDYVEEVTLEKAEDSRGFLIPKDYKGPPQPEPPKQTEGEPPP